MSDEHDDGEDFDAFFDRLEADIEREQAEAISALRARGLEPAPREDQVYAGLPLVSFTLRRPEPGTAEVRFAFQRDDDRRGRIQAWGEEWPGHGVRVPAETLLSALADAWPNIAAGHCSVAPATPFPEAGLTLSPGDLPPVTFHPASKGLTVSAAEGKRDFGAEYVLVVETLMALGDLLSDDLGPETGAARAWAPLRAATDLPPCDVEGEGPGARDQFERQTDWFARRLGVDPDDYRRTAVDLHARHLLAGNLWGRELPLDGIWDPSEVTKNLDVRELATLCEAAARKSNDHGVATTAEEIMDDAVVIRNTDARQAIFYPRDASEPSAPGVRP